MERWLQVLLKSKQQGSLIEEGLIGLYLLVMFWISFCFDKGHCLYLEDRRATPLHSWQDAWSQRNDLGDLSGWVEQSAQDTVTVQIQQTVSSDSKSHPRFYGRTHNSEYLRGCRKGTANLIIYSPLYIEKKENQKCPSQILLVLQIEETQFIEEWGFSLFSYDCYNMVIKLPFLYPRSPILFYP